MKIWDLVTECFFSLFMYLIHTHIHTEHILATFLGKAVGHHFILQ